MSGAGSTSAQQNDPTELLEVFDRSGRPTGVAKTRAAVHIDGDWHQAFHCWIVRPRARVEIVLQRRSFAKDTFPGKWDASSAGHWRYQETPQQAAREIAEELGLDVPFEHLRFGGRERTPRHFSNGLIDREFHQVYVLSDDRPLLAYRPDPREVSGVAAFVASDLLALAAGRVPRIQATESITVSDAGRVSASETTLARADMVPYSAARLRRVLNIGRNSDKR